MANLEANFDDRYFTFSGDKENRRIWGTENPHELHETPLHDQKVTVWAGLCAKTIIGTFFLTFYSLCCLLETLLENLRKFWKARMSVIIFEQETAKTF